MIICILIIYLLTSAAYAQTSEIDNTVDERALKDAIEQTLPEAGAFARSLEDAIAAAQADAEALAETAQRTVDTGEIQTSTSGVDIDALLRDHQPAIEQAQAGQPQALPFIAFVSLSMPEDILKPLIRDVARAGGVAVLRGFKDGSVRTTAAALQEMLGVDASLGGAAIDPRLFRSFAVEAVPTFVMPAGALGVCDAPNCTEPAPAHDRIAGNVTVAYALRQLTEQGEAAPDKAEHYLKRLEASR
ncbi:MAG: type-F conjugative transfer system pilin assembly protein TrbC [Pseudomonadota bacterium]